MEKREADRALLARVLDIYDQRFIGDYLNEVSPAHWSREKVNRWWKGKLALRLTKAEQQALDQLLPKPPTTTKLFEFVDLFAGIGGLRRAFESIGGRCVLTSEWNAAAVRTYKANYDCDPRHHIFNSDIRELTRSTDSNISEEAAYAHIRQAVPDHDVLLAGFPCQPFSIAGVSKKNALGRAHGFECKTQGTLFFDVARILKAKQPAAFLLENVKNLKSHDGGRTFKVITDTLEELGYWLSDQIHSVGNDPRILNSRHFVPQNRERIVLVGFRKDLGLHEGFSLRNISKHYPRAQPKLGDILEDQADDKYVLTQKLWEYLFHYAAAHKKKGNGFGYGLVSKDSVARTLSARYYKDGSEILVDRGFDPHKSLRNRDNIKNRPRRLTPRECARLMGFDKPGQSNFRIPVSDTQAYKQFGNSVVVPAFIAVAKVMKSRIVAANEIRQNRQKKRKRA